MGTDERNGKGVGSEGVAEREGMNVKGENDGVN